jgi:hypothetical protein
VIEFVPIPKVRFRKKGMHVICRWVFRTSGYSVDSTLSMISGGSKSIRSTVCCSVLFPMQGDVDAEQSNTGSRLTPPRRNVEVAIYRQH